MRILCAILLVVVCLTPAFATPDDVVLLQADINISGNGDNTVIPAVAGKVISVYKMWLVSSASVNLVFEDGTTALNAGALPLTANGSSITFFFDGKSYWDTTKGNAFKINLSAPVQVTGRIYYALR